jgi:preprotein translocase subunit SecE
MATEEDVNKAKSEEELEQDEPAEAARADVSIADEPKAQEEAHDVAPVGPASPTQMGTKRFVYAAYFAGAIAIAFLSSKIIDFAWYRLQTWKPSIPEPKDEYVMPIAGLLGLGAAVYYWYRTRARQLAEEVATEMAKVTWPTRTEVTNGTFVVIVTTIISTVFFALMDKFWGFLTNLVYGGT